MIRMHRLSSWRSPAVNIALAVSIITAATDAVAQPMAERPTPFLVQKSRASAPNDRSLLSTLVAEALENSPLVTAAREDFEAMLKVPVQEATLPEPEIGLQNMAVGNPVPGNRLQTSDFAYFGYGFSQEIPFPAKLATRSAIARKEADAARISYEAVKRRVVAEVRESYFNLCYLEQSLRLLDETEVELGRIEAITESQYRLGAAQQQDVLRAQAKLTALEKETAVTRQMYEQGQAALKAELGREQDSAEVQLGALGQAAKPGACQLSGSSAGAGDRSQKRRRAQTGAAKLSSRLQFRLHVPENGRSVPRLLPGFRGGEDPSLFLAATNTCL
jgi:outer membrane protein TolC